MKNRVKKSISLLLAVIMLICVVPVIGSAASYNVTAAVNYANAHWNDGVGLCAEFVSRCLNAGGISIPNYSYYSSGTKSYANNSGTLGSYTNPYTCSASLLLYLSEKYKIITNPSNSDIDVGDVVFMYSMSNGQLKWRDGHVGICVKKVSGSPKYAAHNKAQAAGGFSSSYPCTYVAKINSSSSTHTVNSSYGKNFTAYPKAKITAGNIFDANHNQISSTAWIGTSDKCTIHEVYTDGCCKVTYPLDSGGTRTVYSKISLFNTHTHNYTGDRVYQPEHPHRISQRCVDYASCGGFIWLDEYYNDPNCSQCNRCSGYRIEATSAEIFDSTSVDITIKPFVNDREANDSEIESITLQIKTPSGTVHSVDYGESKTQTFYFGTGDSPNPYGKYVLWAKVNTKYGSYEGSESDGAISITLKKSNLSNGYSFSESTVYRRIKFSDLNTYLTVKSDNNVASYQRISSDQSQVWKITKNSDGSNTIMSMENGKVLDVDDARYVSGRNVLSYTSQNSDNQKWIFRKDKNDLNGRYFISPLKSNSAVLDVYNGNKSNGTNVQIWTYNQGSAQKIEFELPYTISYNAAGGSEAPSSQKKDYGKTLTLSTKKPTRSGYTFLGWSTSKTATSPTYSAGGSYSANADVTLYAVWEANNTYTLTYNANGGSGAPSNQTKTYGQTLTISTTKPTRSGYTFKSWNTKADGSGTTYSSGASYTANANVTLYAQWKANTYTLYFDANGGSGAPQSMTGGTSYTIPSTIPKRFSYNFRGWQYLNDSGSYSYYNPGDKITITKNTTLTAYWVGSSISSAGRTVYSHIVYPGEIYYNKYTPTATGKYVIYSYGDDDTYGYLYDSKGTILASNDDGGEGRNFRIEYTLTAGTTYYFGVKYYSSSKTGTINSKFGLVYTVSYNANRGSGAPSSQSKDWGKNLTLSSTVPTRSGYTFLGWSTSSSATSVTYKAGAAYSANNNVTLYAVWKSNSCSHSYDSGKITTAATCNSTGVKTYTCTVCKATKTETLPKNPSNHVGGTAIKNALAATCTAKGYTGDTYCLGCGVVTVKGKEIAATGHTDTDNDGKCDICGTAVGTPAEPEKPDTPSAACNHICHKSGIAHFFYLIARLFWKMFKTNKYCSCGAAHY